MKPSISDPQQAKKQVELWTPWGVLSIARDVDPVSKSRKLQTSRRLPAKPPIPASDLPPRV